MRKSIGVVVALLLLLVTAVSGDPSAPLSIEQGTSSRANLTATGNDVLAQAGNVTELSLNGISITNTWQGYYGNVTGRLTLQNANNNTLYDWSTISSEGEVYASLNDTINWSSVGCVNFTANGSDALNVSLLETQFGIQDGDVDGFNETFNQTFSGEFLVGTVKINVSNNCPMTTLYNSSGAQSVHFQELLLEDTSSDTLIFASIVDNDQDGFIGGPVDFQMLVAEDGHSGDTATTTYYFYTEMV